MNTIIILLAIGTITAAAIAGGKHLPMVLPQLHNVFDRKPFNCRPCFTFHSLWIGMGGIAWGADSWELFAGGIILAFIIFFIIRHIDNKQIVE